VKNRIIDICPKKRRIIIEKAMSVITQKNNLIGEREEQ
jgi:hypothetical protein